MTAARAALKVHREFLDDIVRHLRQSAALHSDYRGGDKEAKFVERVISALEFDICGALDNAKTRADKQLK